MGNEKNIYESDSREGEDVTVEPAHGREENIMNDEYQQKKPWWHPIIEPGSAPQIILAAGLAIGIGMAVNATVDEVPNPAVVILGIPGRLWLRALTAVVLPLIVCAMILAIQRLKEMQRGGGLLARWTILWYIITTILAICHSVILMALVWRRQLTEVAAEDLATSEAQQELISERESVTIEEVVQGMFDSIITNNIVNALASQSLLAVLVVAIIVGYLIEDPNSPILALTREVERMITKVITFLIKLAPVGVFFLILSNIMRLDMASVGRNLGVLIGVTIAQLFFHLFVVLPVLYYAITRRNPYTMWFKCSKAWITAWGTASSAATLPVTMKCVANMGVPNTIAKFAVPLGCLVNMDGTAIYLPIVVVFLAQTQGIVLNAAEYVIVVLLSTLAAIGVSPIPSASLVLIVMICGSVNVPVGGMYAVVVAIDWFLDRFRTATNVSGDLFAAGILYKITGIEDPEDEHETVDQVVAEAQAAYNRETQY